MHLHALQHNLLVRLWHEEMYFVLLFSFASEKFYVLLWKTYRMKTIYVVENFQDSYLYVNLWLMNSVLSAFMYFIL